MALKRFSDFHNENCGGEDEIDIKKKGVIETPEVEETTEEEEEKESIEESVEIEILEENIIKFKGDIKKIYELIQSKYPYVDYFLRQKGNDIHVIKYNEAIKLNVNAFVDSLFKFYSTKSKSMVENLKIKGNEKFSLIENLKEENVDRVIKDLSKLLTKQK